ncbi:hypothetical protein KFE25_014428 [Diacronema lutheri]|mgnify:CR=1 FL=1|uniref:Uncharacterized protein n=1 Tax=Diacronema lutheri TaxID=2081491 RepID=A0A8J5XJN9_DIALT|nr:hypothetical protein KFE25_014428 [Diacronema lutheri]
MAALQATLYGVSRGGWDAEGRPSARELAAHNAALRRDAVGLGVVLALFLSSARAFADARPSRQFVAACQPGEQLARGAAGLLCALGAASALAVDLLVCPCPAVSDAKYRAIRVLGHFAYLTVQSLAIISTHLAISALADVCLDPLVAPLLPASVTRAALALHAASHMHAEWVCALALVLALFFFPLALLHPQWEADEVRPWRRRGVGSFKALNLYSHGAAVPCALLELLLLRSRPLLAQLAPPFRVLAAVSIAYGSVYPLSVHIGYNLHEMRRVALERARAQRADSALPRVKSHPTHAWPYGFMDDLAQLGAPPMRLHSWGVRPPFSAGWVLLALAGTASNLLVLACVRQLHVSARES